jgi:hypothetical protein
VISVGAIARLPSTGDGAGAFARALRDPRVLNVAKAMNIDLADPGTFMTLLSRARSAIDDTTKVTISAAASAPSGATDIDPETIANRYVRDAIRTYQAVSRMA